LTEKGSHLLDEGVRARHGWLNDLAEILSQEEKELINKALDLLINKANQLEDLIE
jgi:DNA-binding MarR family transcriptional regulator